MMSSRNIRYQIFISISFAVFTTLSISDSNAFGEKANLETLQLMQVVGTIRNYRNYY
jgi:hypothetical protein